MTEAAHQIASNPLPPAATQARHRGPRGRARGRRSWTTAGRLLAAGETGEIVIRGANVTAGYENNPKPTRRVHRRLVPHRRSGRARRATATSRITGRLEGDHQPRRREDLAARGGRGADGASRRGAGRSTFAVPHDKLGEEVARGGGAARGQAGRRARSCAISPRRGSRTSRCRAASCFWTRFRKAPRASCSGSAWRKSSASVDPALIGAALFGAAPWRRSSAAPWR